MTNEQLKRLRAYFRTLNGQAVLLERLTDPVVTESVVQPIEEEILEAIQEFPGLLPSFKRETFFSHNAGRGAYYRRDGLALQLQRALGKIQEAITEDERSPVTEVREFSYITDVALRSLVRDDYQEVQRAFVSRCWKATIILSGSLIEALLLFAVTRDRNAALTASAAPPKISIDRWSLSSLIDVSVELGLVGSGVQKLSHSVREYRNLVHPGNALRTTLTSGAEEARIALEVLHLVDRDLAL